MKKLSTQTLIVALLILIALPFVFMPDLLTEDNEEVLETIGLSVLIIYLAINIWQMIKSK